MEVVWWSGGHRTAINIKQSGGWWLVVARLNTKLVAGLHDHIVMRGAAPSLRSLNSLISTSSDCPHARLPPSSPSPLHNKFLIGAVGAPSTINHYSKTPIFRDSLSYNFILLVSMVQLVQNTMLLSSHHIMKSVDVDVTKCCNPNNSIYSICKIHRLKEKSSLKPDK